METFLTDMPWILMSYLLLGMVAGLGAGLLGVGGGAILVPGLIVLFAYQAMSEALIMHLAVGTSLMVIIPTAISSIWAHHRRASVNWQLVLLFAPGLMLGAALGAGIADALERGWLQRLFAVFLVLVSLQMLFHHPANGHRKLPHAIHVPVSFIIGLISAMVGIGGGSMTVPYLNWNGIRIHLAVGTSAACGLPIAVAGAVAFMWLGPSEIGGQGQHTGYVYWPAAIVLASLSTLFAPLGARLAHALPVASLKRLFATILMLIGIRLFY